MEMIRFRTTIEFRDDKSKVMDLSETPSQSNEYWFLQKDSNNWEFIPKEAIKSLKVKSYWRGNKK